MAAALGDNRKATAPPRSVCANDFGMGSREGQFGTTRDVNGAAERLSIENFYTRYNHSYDLRLDKPNLCGRKSTISQSA
jgi:hypothetical protein